MGGLLDDRIGIQPGHEITLELLQRGQDLVSQLLLDRCFAQGHEDLVAVDAVTDVTVIKVQVDREFSADDPCGGRGLVLVAHVPDGMGLEVVRAAMLFKLDLGGSIVVVATVDAMRMPEHRPPLNFEMHHLRKGLTLLRYGSSPLHFC